LQAAFSPLPNLSPNGVTVAVVDGLIAETALEHRLTVVTRNVKDFEGLGVPIINPWESV
jgi:predicted nucleic acid-binding protein